MDLIKTWPAFMERKHTLEVFTHPWGRFYFSLGRGCPKQAVKRIFFVHRGKILGSFRIGEIVRNAGQLPKLRALDGGKSEWQIKPDAWVAICPPPFQRVPGGAVHHESFRGWRYFELEKHRGTLDAKVAI